MQAALFGIRRFVRRTRRRARVLWRAVVLHVLVLALILLGLFARMTESSELEWALAQRTAAVARLDARTGPAAAPAHAAASSSAPVPLPFPLGAPVAGAPLADVALGSSAP